MSMLGPTLALLMLVDSGNATGITLSVSGNPDAVLSYECRLAGGGAEVGEAEPPFTVRWTADGVACRFRQETGHGQVTIELHAGGSRQIVRTRGADSTVRLRYGAVR